MDISRRLLIGGFAGMAAMPKALAAGSEKPAPTGASAHEELTAIVRGYAQMAGFSASAVNRKG